MYPSVETSIYDLRAHNRNARLHSASQIQKLAESIRLFGFTAPLIVNKGGTILAGHGRFEAAVLAGLSTVPCIMVDYPPEKARAYLIADNKLSELSTWDEDKLEQELDAIEASGFDISFLDDFDESYGDDPGSGAGSDTDRLTKQTFGGMPAVGGLDPGSGSGGASLVQERGAVAETVVFLNKRVQISAVEAEKLMTVFDRYTSQRGTTYGFFNFLLEPHLATAP